MSTSTKVGGYLVALAVVFAAALGIGAAVGPVGPAADQPLHSQPADRGGNGMEMDMGDGASD